MLLFRALMSASGGLVVSMFQIASLSTIESVFENDGFGFEKTTRAFSADQGTTTRHHYCW